MPAFFRYLISSPALLLQKSGQPIVYPVPELHNIETAIHGDPGVRALDYECYFVMRERIVKETINRLKTNNKKMTPYLYGSLSPSYDVMI